MFSNHSQVEHTRIPHITFFGYFLSFIFFSWFGAQIYIEELHSLFFLFLFDYCVISISEVFPNVSLKFAGGASMVLRPKDYLLVDRRSVSNSQALFFFNIFHFSKDWLERFTWLICQLSELNLYWRRRYIYWIWKTSGPITVVASNDCDFSRVFFYFFKIALAVRSDDRWIRSNTIANLF